MKIAMMNTIDGTYKKCKEENIGVSRQYITYLIKNNLIPGCKVGRKYLINWEGLMRYLEGYNINNKEENLKTERGKIRAIG